MNVPIPSTIFATVLLSLALCFAIALIAGLSRRAKRGLVGMLKLYENKNLLYFSIFWMLIFSASYFLVSNPALLIIGSTPMLLWFFGRIFKKIFKRKNKHEIQTY